MGRKSNLRKKFGKLKLRHEYEDDRRLAIEGSRKMENNGDNDASVESSGDDRLTYLPEKIISNILSRLEIMEAVRTCVLSKSWVDKWISITELTCFDGFPFPRLHFLDGLESVIQKVSCMKKFSLYCLYMQDPSRLKPLILSALRCNPLESLNVSMISTPCVFWLRSFDRNSLTKLELNGNFFLINVTADVCFRHLRSLKLCDVTVRNSYLPGKVVMRMPILEDFELIQCTFWNVESLEIVAPLLSTIKVIRCTYFDLTGMFAHCVMEISGGGNMGFTYVGSASEEFVIRNPSNVAVANLKLCLTLISSGCRNFLLEVASEARLLLEKFHTCLNMLELSRDVVMALAFGPSYPIPIFENLKYAKIPMLWCFTCSDVNNVALELLMNAPFLEELTISAIATCKMCKKCKRRASKQKFSNVGMFKRLVTGNFMVHLNRVRFESFCRWVEEVELVRFFLAHASVLEELSIPVTCLAVAKKLEKQFSAFPKASGNASVVFRFEE